MIDFKLGRRTCDRCGGRAVMILEACGRNRRREYPTLQDICPDCVTTEVRVIDGMGCVPVGHYLDAKDLDAKGANP